MNAPENLPPWFYYLDDILRQAVIFVFVPAILSLALVFARPEGRNRFGPLPPVLRLRPAIATVLRKSLDGHGRAGRAEFWWAMLAATLLALIPLGLALRFSYWIALAALIPFAPLVSAGARRLHDIGRSGWWQFLALTGLGLITLIVLWAVPSQKPEDSEAADVF